MSEAKKTAQSTADLKAYYKNVVVPQLQNEFGFKSIMQVPKITKVVLNMGLGEAVADKKIIAHAIDDLTAIAGQKAVQTVARKSIATFKIRDGWPIGAKVTLRGKKMYAFLNRLINVAIPRIRDFRGLNAKAFDGRGNFAMGISEQIVFAEVDYDKIDVLRGLDICITTSATNNKEGYALLKALNFPLKKSKEG
jgi:large subunit ribosomal protein L5